MSTSKILSHVFNRYTLDEQFDVTSSDILTQNNLLTKYVDRHSSEEPIQVQPGKWSTFDYGDYTALNKTYKFNSQDHFMYFVNEVLNESSRVDHSVKMIIEHLSVELVLYTHDINDITESDISLSKSIDEIYQDIFFIE